MALPPIPERRPRLILHADASRDVAAGLALSVELAVALQMEIAALFIVEDASIDACGLPFPTHIGFSGRALTLDPARLERLIRREAEACRRMLAEAAARRALAWSFESRRGEPAALLRAEAAAHDIVVVRLDGVGGGTHRTIGQARALAPSHGGVLFVPVDRGPRRGPVVILARSSQEGERTADVALSLAQALGVAVDHVVLAGPGRAAGVAPLSRTASLMVVSTDSPLLDDEATLRRLVVGLGAPLLVLRAAPDRT